MAQYHILITGGSGLIGRELTTALLNRGYQVSHLSRHPGNDPRIKTFLWDIAKGQIDEECLDGIDTIVHLSGAGVADKRWTKKRKEEIINSRVMSIGLLYQLIKRKPNQVKSVISASGISYYGDRGDDLITENTAPANDFLGRCCILWEQAVDQGKAMSLRIVKYRTGIVLTKAGGALPTLAKPIRLGVGAALGTGKQWIPWIHITDTVNMYLKAIEDENLSGVFNMVAPQPVTNKKLTQAVARQLHRPYWMPNVPAFVIRLLFGEMGTVVLASVRSSSFKIEEAGFNFKYPIIEDALKELYG